MMPTIDDEPNATEPVPESVLDTHRGPAEVFDDRFRRSRMRAEIFGGDAPELRLGRYRIDERLGVGAMGSVYLAVDQGLDRNVAIKVLRRQDEVDRARIQAEAKALAKLSHPNVVTVHEVGEHDGEAFVAMEYVAGQTLTSWLQTKRTLPEILWVFDQAASGLHAAHAAGIVHRDFKPDNVLVGADGRVRVVDFGMARSLDAPLTQQVDDAGTSVTVAAPTLTRTGVLAGTPAYMSPEQFLGANVDARADQFAFCIALHEAIWGTRPFRGETLAELAKSVTTEAPVLSVGRPALESQEAERVRGVIARGLSVRPDDRHVSMAALFDELRPRVRSVSGRAGGGARVLLALALVSTLVLFFAGIGAYFFLLRS